jgi:hypothetical protein
MLFSAERRHNMNVAGQISGISKGKKVNLLRPCFVQLARLGSKFAAPVATLDCFTIQQDGGGKPKSGLPTNINKVIR